MFKDLRKISFGLFSSSMFDAPLPTTFSTFSEAFLAILPSFRHLHHCRHRTCPKIIQNRFLFLVFPGSILEVQHIPALFLVLCCDWAVIVD